MTVTPASIALSCIRRIRTSRFLEYTPEVLRAYREKNWPVHSRKDLAAVDDLERWHPDVFVPTPLALMALLEDVQHRARSGSPERLESLYQTTHKILEEDESGLSEEEVTSTVLTAMAVTSMTLAAFNQGKNVFTFDPMVADALEKTNMEKVSEVFTRLPYYGQFIDLSNLGWDHPNGGKCLGVFVALTYQVSSWAEVGPGEEPPGGGDVVGKKYLVMMHVSDAPLLPGAYPYSLQYEPLGVRPTGRVAIGTRGALEMEETLVDLYKRTLPLVAYICSEEPDIKRSKPVVRGKRKKKKKVKPRGSRPVVYECGFYIGKNMRKAEEIIAAAEKEDTDSSVRRPTRPHIRQAHWHSYWKGARNSKERRKTAKWLPPILVGGKVNSLTIRKVTKGTRTHEVTEARPEAPAELPSLGGPD